MSIRMNGTILKQDEHVSAINSLQTVMLLKYYDSFKNPKLSLTLTFAS